MRDTIYSFQTANLSVRAYAERETFQPDFDDDEAIEAINNGDLEWFMVTIEVTHRGTGAELGSDHLGGCCYKSTKEFVTGHRDPNPMNRNCTIQKNATGYCIGHYFPGMVSQACDEARKTLGEIKALRLRTA